MSTFIPVSRSARDIKKKLTAPSLLKQTLVLQGADILHSAGMQMERLHCHHGAISTYLHSVNVAYFSLLLAAYLHLRINQQALVRGALLHDYYLYDWHVPDPSHRLHGLFHAKKALDNAQRDFRLTAVERDIIRTHMFPLNLRPPKYKESLLVCIADKLCAFYESAPFSPCRATILPRTVSK